MTVVRAVAAEQYREESSKLDRYQRIWLVDEYRQERKQQEEWLDKLCKSIVVWISEAYKNRIKKPVALGSAERAYIREMVETFRGALR